MSPAAILQTAPACSSTASPTEQTPRSPATPVSNGPAPFDDIFKAKFFQIIDEFKEKPRFQPLTATERKAFIYRAYAEADEVFFANRELGEYEQRMRAMTKVFYTILAEEPWTDDYIRPHDVERKLSRFEMHKDSVELAAKHGLHTPREAIAAARQHLINLDKLDPKDRPGPRGPFDDIEVIYIPGTVSSTATNNINRDTIYPVSVASVAHTLHTHICRDMTEPYKMAEKFVYCTDTEELLKLRKFACDVVDYTPHLLDNDNVSLLLVLLILARSDITRRFEANGIRIEGSTISHRRAECLKTKIGWRTADERKPFDNVSTDLQTRVKNAYSPVSRTHRTTRKVTRKSAGPATPTMTTPETGFFAPPKPFIAFKAFKVPQAAGPDSRSQMPSTPALPSAAPQQNGADQDAMDTS
ncbi:uncharacterized protein EI97DRAFT_413771 [Westerdykella ornata]|uniref:Uncharacterized protein n=1 Tax=Westerdykella ornata TaxID=318751 RepID=A0A6A6JSY9_WESOR|nr:uncharacterized protein EI97DRAFT_413771 [Westerdykella ornata]KAF2278856.1 hypothetical protein EI97DRAFT_413771 [Westerdykella ornata]